MRRKPRQLFTEIGDLDRAVTCDRDGTQQLQRLLRSTQGIGCRVVGEGEIASKRVTPLRQ